ncbi:MAG: aryl-sulfate sulfotransferase [Nannocystaceae bacterium]
MRRRASGLALALALACGGEGATATSDADAGSDATSEPGALELRDLSLTPDPGNHLALIVRFTTSAPARGEVELRDDDGLAWITAGDDAEATAHELYVIGLRAEATFTVTARAQADDGELVEAAPQAHTPGPLPPDFPAIWAEGQVASDVPGWTFFGVARWAGDHLDYSWGLVIAVDRRGRVVWYRRIPDGGSDIRVTDSGEVWFGEADLIVHRMTLAGDDRGSWVAGELSPPVDTLHHESIETPEGDLLSLSTELRTVSGFEGGAVSYNLVGDVVVQVTREGALRGRWSLLDLLDDADLHRVRPGFHDAFWDGFYTVPGGTKDWSHANGVAPDEDRGLYLVSARHLDWIIAVDPLASEVAWRLGEDGDFTLTEGAWFYHQHAPEVQEGGRLLVYDNGNNRPGTGFRPGDAPLYTRVVEYALDDDAMTATQTWEWIADPPRFSGFVGDADRLVDGHVLITDGGLFNLEAPSGVVLYSIVEEVDPSDQGTVFRLHVGDPDGPTSYTVYRADRVAGVY